MPKLFTLIKSYRKAFVFVIAVGLIAYYVTARISVTITPSLKKRIFWISGKPGMGDSLRSKFVMIDLPENPYLPKPATRKTIKRVGCSEGDRLEVVGDSYMCNGTPIGRGKHFTLKGEPVRLFTFSGTIPPGSIFVIGDHPDSFDSRYFGFINKSEVIAVVFPII